MEKSVIINLIILGIITLSTIIVILNYFSLEEKTECIEANLLYRVKYNACYDSYTSKLVILVNNEEPNKNITTIEMQTNKNKIILYPAPIFGKEERYEFEVPENPNIIYANLFVENITNCPELKKILVKNCDSTPSQNVSITTGSNQTITNLTNKTQTPNSDILTKDLIDPDLIWETEKCDSNWVCEEWEDCTNGIQRRECYDKKECRIPNNIPFFTRYCANNCMENWICEWSSCSAGFTTPSCEDSNSCRTNFTKPSKLPCETAKKECIPDIKCSEWSSCNIDYDFNSLFTGVNNLRGTKERYCTDKNDCINPQKQKIFCSTKIDIKVEKKTSGGISYFDVYNNLTNQVITKLKSYEYTDVPELDIYF